MDSIVHTLCQYQSPGGAFGSTVHLPFGKEPDDNCFATALVLRELAPLLGVDDRQGAEGLAGACRRAAGYLMRNRYPVYPNLYSFYPHRRHPYWMDNALYADADDTSIIALELVRLGYKPADTLDYIADTYLQKYRATGEFARHLTAPWHHEGVFLTWLTTADLVNPIDCCVNANVVALLAAAGLTKQGGYAEATGMINSAVAWAGDHPVRLREITPYYPHPLELYRAVEHAVDSGAGELAPARDTLAAIPWLFDALNSERPVPICSSVDGGTFWIADAVHTARRLKHSMIAGELGLCQG